MIRRLCGVGLGLGMCCVASPAAADDNAGLALGLRVGYAIPTGNTGTLQGKASSEVELHDVVTAMVPLWFDAGYRFNPALYAGAFFQYGFALINDDSISGCNQGWSCSGHDMAFGANLLYHTMPQSTVDPWLGAGFGYEVLTVNTSGTQPGGGPFDGSWKLKGFQFLILEAGADYKATPSLAVGPFLNFALGGYSRVSNRETFDGIVQETSGDLNGSTHMWLTFGVRGQYNL